MSAISSVNLQCISLISIALAGCPNSDQPPAAPAMALGTQSTVDGPFANEPVAEPSSMAALTTVASHAPLLRGQTSATPQPTPSTETAQPTGNTDESEPEEPTPTVPTNVNPTSPRRDALIDGLIGRWVTNDPETTRPSGGWVRGNCVLTVRSASDAREDCTTQTQYGANELDSCRQTGMLRTRTTSNPYTISVQNGVVHFEPGDPFPVRDTHCNPAPGQRHTVMDAVDWRGSGGTLRVRNSTRTSSNTWESTYRREYPSRGE
jgi:hypothetical protein